MSLTDLLSLLQGKHWLAIIALTTLVLRKWTSEDSAFPISIPPAWQGTVSAAGGLVYGFVSIVQSGSSLETAVVSMALTAGSVGFLDGLMTAIFNHGSAPKWARAIVFIFDDLTTSGPPTPPAPTPAIPPPPPVPVIPSPPAAPVAHSRGLAVTTAWVGLAAFCFGLLMALSGCAKLPSLPPGSPVPADVEADIVCVTQGLVEGKNFQQLEASCMPGQEELLADLLAQLLVSPSFAQEHPEAAAALSKVYQAAKQQGFKTTSERRCAE